MQQVKINTAKEIYQNYIEKVEFEEIQHVPEQFMENQITVQEDCLCINYKFFQQYYPPLMNLLSQKNDLDHKNWICEMLLVMNGQNDKAWNTKKNLLLEGTLHLQRELKFNAAVCYKFKKSSSYYDYRIKIFQLIAKSVNHQELLQLYRRQTKLISKILGRFFRNYYCWMYRNRLFKMLLPICGQKLLQLEVTSLHKFLELNPNDYSAYSRLISIVKQNACDKQQQLQWLKQLQQFCQAAYEHNESYRHTNTYKHFLLTL